MTPTNLRMLKEWWRSIHRKWEEPAGAQDEVIVLSSDSEAETSRPAQRHQVGQDTADSAQRDHKMSGYAKQPLHVQRKGGMLQASSWQTRQAEVC